VSIATNPETVLLEVEEAHDEDTQVCADGQDEDQSPPVLTPVPKPKSKRLENRRKRFLGTEIYYDTPSLRNVTSRISSPGVNGETTEVPTETTSTHKVAVSLDSTSFRFRDADELFLLSLMPGLKKLNEQEKSLLKIQMLQMLHEAQFPKKDSALDRRELVGTHSICSNPYEDNGVSEKRIKIDY